MGSRSFWVVFFAFFLFSLIGVVDWRQSGCERGFDRRPERPVQMGRATSHCRRVVGWLVVRLRGAGHCPFVGRSAFTQATR